VGALPPAALGPTVEVAVMSVLTIVILSSGLVMGLLAALLALWFGGRISALPPGSSSTRQILLFLALIGAMAVAGALLVALFGVRGH
jgi:hypothetical protein